MRPADILTGGVHPTLTVAVDIGVKAPHAADAGESPMEEMRRDKFDKYEIHLPDFQRQGIAYEPAIFSCYGRWHPRATQLLEHGAARAARRSGHANSSRLLRGWRRQVTAELWRRAARMAQACFPRGHDASGTVEDGEAEGDDGDAPATKSDGC